MGFNKVSALAARLGRVVIREGNDGGDRFDANSMLSNTTLVRDGFTTDSPVGDIRSLSRAREVFQSYGRGGAGNIRRSSQSREPRPYDVPEKISLTRGREPAVHPDRIYSTGRGGAGNMRSLSREPGSVRSVHEDVIAECEYEQCILREHTAAEAVHSSGRGGAGNIANSRSRSRGPGLPLYSTGRGGAGNMVFGDVRSSDTLDQEERYKHHRPEGMHSTGRGGVANMTDAHEPDVEPTHHHAHPGEYLSTGRGGVGNIRSPSQSRASADGGQRGAVSGLLHK
ncbi:hypothetical protein EDC04DRAFT_3150213 [Pisolithus marmoratus]|nr:hypothetical protein EDC04DRAFT_3150213 [Pisolithus marmoratus]